MGRYLERHYSAAWGSGLASPGFYYGSAGSFDDLILFWNLRACDIDLLFYDPEQAPRLDALRDSYLSWLRSRPTDPSGWDDRIIVWARTRETAEAVPNWGSDIGRATADSGIWNGLNLRPPLMRFSEQSVLASVSDEQSRPVATFQVPTKPFFSEAELHSQTLALSIHPIVDIHTTEEVTFRAPYIPELNEFYSRHIDFRPDTVRAEADGVARVLSVTDDHVTHRSLTVRDLIQEVFQAFGIAAKPSQPGLIASRLIGQMGGIQGCRVFKISGVRKLIESYNPYQWFTRSAAIQLIGNNDPTTGRPRFDQFERLFLEPRPGPRLKPEDALTYLVTKEVFRIGLRLTCSRCQLDFWRSLDDVATFATCEYCGHRFNVAPQLRDRDWAYRRSGLFGRDDHQEGSIPVVLTLQQLDTVLDFREMLYSTSMTLTPTTAPIDKCETDLVVMSQNNEGRVQLGIGECKGAKEISQEDVDNLRRVADAFPTHRVNTFVIFAKVSGFTAVEIERCHLAQEKYRKRVILLTGRELEPYFVYEDTEKHFDIPRHANSLEDLAEATDRIFFNPQRRQ